MDDARRVLVTAAEARAGVEVLPRGGAPSRGQVVRVERGGVVLALAGAPPSPGTDVRCWLTVDGVAFTFEASVLRSGIDVPDRSQGGVLLGFIDGWARASSEPGGLTLAALPASGGVLGLNEGSVHAIELHPEEWLVSAPAAFPLVFVEGGRLRLRVGPGDRAPVEVGATVRAVTRAQDHILYRLAIDEVGDPERYRDALGAARAALKL